MPTTFNQWAPIMINTWVITNSSLPQRSCIDILYPFDFMDLCKQSLEDMFTNFILMHNFIVLSIALQNDYTVLLL